jgi:hypothetical protein
MVMVRVLGGALRDTVTVSVEDSVPLTVAGLRLNDTPPPPPVALSATVDVKPPDGTTEIVDTPEPLRATVMLDGEAETEKSPVCACAFTVRLIVVV